MKDILLKETPLKDTSLKDTSLKDTSLKDTLLKDTSLKDTSLAVQATVRTLAGSGFRKVKSRSRRIVLPFLRNLSHGDRVAE